MSKRVLEFVDNGFQVTKKNNNSNITSNNNNNNNIYSNKNIEMLPIKINSPFFNNGNNSIQVTSKPIIQQQQPQQSLPKLNKQKQQQQQISPPKPIMQHQTSPPKPNIQQHQQQISPPKRNLQQQQQHQQISPPKPILQQISPPKDNNLIKKIVTKNHLVDQLAGYKPNGGVTFKSGLNNISSNNNYNIFSKNNNSNKIATTTMTSSTTIKIANNSNNNNINNINNNIINSSTNNKLNNNNNNLSYNEVIGNIDVEDFDISTSQFVCGISQDFGTVKVESEDNGKENMTQEDLEEAATYSQSFQEELNYNMGLISNKNPQYNQLNKQKSTTITTIGNNNNNKSNSNNISKNTNNINNNSNNKQTDKSIKYSKLNFDPKLIGNDITLCCEKIFGLPKMVGEIYKRRGLTSLYNWQKECLSTPEVLMGENLVYSLPTSGGKTLVAEIILFRNLLIRKKKSLFIFPFVSIVSERVQALQEFAAELSFQVEGYFGCNGTMPVLPGPRMLISTIEKANIIVNQLIEDKALMDIGCVVIDELHMIGDGDRGELLEILISKILFMSKGEIQVIGMSATIPNIQNLQKWLRGHVFQGDFRPVPLTEYIKIDNNVYDKDNNLIKVLDGTDKDSHTLQLITEVIPNHSVLVFCPSKVMTVSLATYLSKEFPENVLLDKKDQRETLIQLLESSNGCKIDEELKRMILAGVAYHNSDLTNDEREIVEKGFKERSLLVLCSTSTLSTGVNLPARRVILKSPTMGRDLISNRVYRQMVGRAGRAGIDEFGESILMCDPKQAERCKKLLNSPLDPLLSCIKPSSQSFQKIVLDSICSGIADNKISILDFLNYSYYITHIIPPKNMTPYQFMENLVVKSIEELLKEGYINEIKNEDNKKDTGLNESETTTKYEYTGFGFACFRSCLNIREAKLVHKELKKIYESSIVISEPLHMCYITTPFFNLPEIPDWNYYLGLYQEYRKKPKKLQVMESIGIDGQYIYNRLNNLDMDSQEELKYKRFYIAMVLYEIVNEQQLHMASNKYKLNRGTVQTLMQSAGSFSWMVSLFCKKMGWIELEVLVGLYTQRLDKGVKPEIIPLVEINGVKQARARALWNAGFKTVKSIAVCSPEELSSKVKLGKFGESAAKSIIREAGKLLEKKAEEFRAKANELANQFNW